QSSTMKTALKLTGAGGGGDAVVFFHKGKREELSRQLDTYNEHQEVPITIDYVSDFDGSETEGVTLVHENEAAIVMQTENAKLETYEYWHNDEMRRVTSEQWDRLSKKAPIVLDGVENRMLVQGKRPKPGPKSLYTTEATVKMLVKAMRT